MYIITAIPVTHKTPMDTLSYFSKVPYNKGACIVGPLGKQTVTVLVIKTEPAQNLKQNVKNASFVLRNMPVQQPLFVLPYIHIYEQIATYHIQPLAYVVRQLLPFDFLKSIQITQEKTKPSFEEIEILQESTQNRIDYLRGLTREAFAKNTSCIIVVPTTENAKAISIQLEKGIEQYVHTVTSATTEKQMNLFLKALEQDTPLLIITTPYYLPLSIHRKNILVLESESSPFYKDHISHIDMALYVKILGSYFSEKLILSDTLLTWETLHKHSTNHYKNILPISWPNKNTHKDLDIEIATRPKGKSYTLFSDEVRQTIEEVIQKKSKIILFGLRKGLATESKCQTCMRVLSCTQCETPLVLVTQLEGRMFICNSCNKTYGVFTPCQSCGGNNIIPFGVGTETIETEVQNKYPDLPLFKIDTLADGKTVTKTQIKKILKEFKTAPHGCLIINTSILYALQYTVPYSAIISLDTLFDLPMLDSERKILDTIERITSITEKKSTLQFFDITRPLLVAYTQNQLHIWVKNHLEEKQRFHFPPFSLVIKYICKDTNEETIKQLQHTWDSFESIQKDRSILFHKKKQTHTFIGRIYIQNPHIENKHYYDDVSLSLPRHIYDTLVALSSIGDIYINPESLL